MKKILGILGITLVMAVSFFNMSSIVDVNNNVDLATIIQKASADPEVEVKMVKDMSEVKSSTVKTFVTDSGDICSITTSMEGVICSGTGPISCGAYMNITVVNGPGCF